MCLLKYSLCLKNYFLVCMDISIWKLKLKAKGNFLNKLQISFVDNHEIYLSYHLLSSLKNSLYV